MQTQGHFGKKFQWKFRVSRSFAPHLEIDLLGQQSWYQWKHATSY